ncbi:Tetratricopeptide repeat-containing protein [Singulisphaera sp. GP187]|uniref:tetratricopeptide repeat protein n=1 Tax=Singulisphaera sp. GP187 TaxID=1882752 RepID=UPI00092764CB|nr:tetratricopeptide repeat protein [Singulisphaera sp. GP187]SIO60345.1 Tetratricopeptide repeat-containing protein [Singulisphaera sp. GP187]
MTRTLWKLALGISLALLASPSDVLAGRGGGRGGGGGFGGGGGGENRGGNGGGSRGGAMGGTPSFSQSRQPMNQSRGSGDSGRGNQPGSGTRSQSGNPAAAANRNQGPSNAGAAAGYANRNQGPSNAGAAAGYANRNQGPSNAGTAAAGAGYANRNQGPSNAGAAAAGAGYANRNQGPSNAGAAAAGAGYANRNQGPSNAGAAAAGAGYANRNQGPSNAGAAAAGAGYANRNQGPSNAGAAAAGAGYANRNQGPSNAGAAAAGAGYANRNQGLSNAGAAAAGAGYANRNQYDGYHPGVVNGYWNGNNSAAWGAAGYGLGATTGVGAWGAGSPIYAYGYSGYNNPYASGMGGGSQQPGNAPQQAAAPAADYSQPISTTAASPEPAVADQATSAFDQAREAFKAGDYANALQLDQQALTQMPNDTTLHEFLALVLFAQGKYEQAAAPLYAVLSVGPGWDWTTLSGMYPDVATYTGQLRNLETYIAANPKSAQARFVLAYQYLSEGHDENAVDQLKQVVKLQPDDTLSAQLVARFQPSGDAPPASAGSAPAGAPAVDGKLPGKWAATPAKDANIALTIQDDGRFTWAATGQGKPPTTIAGASTFADGVLTFVDQGGQSGSLVGNVTWQNADQFNFRLAGAPPTDPGLNFTR